MMTKKQQQSARQLWHPSMMSPPANVWRCSYCPHIRSLSSNQSSKQRSGDQSSRNQSSGNQSSGDQSSRNQSGRNQSSSKQSSKGRGSSRTYPPVPGRCRCRICTCDDARTVSGVH